MVESEDLIHKTAHAVKAAGAHVLRGEHLNLCLFRTGALSTMRLERKE